LETRSKSGSLAHLVAERKRTAAKAPWRRVVGPSRARQAPRNEGRRLGHLDGCGLSNHSPNQTPWIANS
jgi:hypothetical protein